MDEDKRSEWEAETPQELDKESKPDSEQEQADEVSPTPATERAPEPEAETVSEPFPEPAPPQETEPAESPAETAETELVSEPEPEPAAEPAAEPVADSTPEPTPAETLPAVEPAVGKPPPAPNSTETSESDFAKLLAASETGRASGPAAGDKVTGTIIQIGDTDSFVDCGARSELAIATTELHDDQGALQYQEGDSITGHVQKIKGELRLTLSLDLRDSGLEALQQAFQDNTPLSGTVRETNKGGFTVDLGGRRAFCPYSQIDLRRVENPDGFVGQAYSFRIIELSADGRNIVLSRRAILQEERDSAATATRESLSIEDVREGTVTRLVPFGAFVDIGGVEGLVHISQISHQRIPDPAAVLKTGQEVKVMVLDIQNLGQGRKERISLSLKALAEDPWPATAKQLQIGTSVPGRVTRLADFGAFVELQPGVEGLIHISELAPHRLFHPQEVVAAGDEITVRILDIDLDRQRISLSLKETGGGAD